MPIAEHREAAALAERGGRPQVVVADRARHHQRGAVRRAHAERLVDVRQPPLVGGQQLGELRLDAERRVAVLQDAVHGPIVERVQAVHVAQIGQQLNAARHIGELLGAGDLQRNDAQVLAAQHQRAALRRVVEQQRPPFQVIDALVQQLRLVESTRI